MQKFIITITTPNEQIVVDEKAVCHILSTSLPEDALNQYVQSLRQTESLILLRGANAVDLCKKYHCDGIIADINNDLPYKKQLLPLRDSLGHKKIIGAVIPLLRHAAMIVGETEPDFIIFNIDSDDEVDKAKKLIDWYNELFLIQSAITGQVDSALLTRLGTDFVMISPRNYKILVAKNKSLD